MQLMIMSSSRVYNDIAEGEKQHKEELPELSIRAADTVADLDDCLYIVGSIFVLHQ